MTPDIDIDGVEVRFDDVTAVDGLTAHLEGGKIHGLLGRNGSGKTTLMSVVAAFRRPDAGEVRIGGVPVYEHPETTRQVCLIRGTGDTLERSEKVGEALRVAAMMRPRWDADLSERLVERFEIDPRKRIGALSRGQRAALGVTLGLAARAPVTMFDESYLGMDAPSRYAFYEELLADFMAHPRTIMISTHHIDEVAGLFEQVVLLGRGRVLVQDDVDELRARGVAVTGRHGDVDRFAAGCDVLAERRLGDTKSVTLYGSLPPERLAEAARLGLDVGPVALQDLFVHLTAEPGGADAATS